MVRDEQAVSVTVTALSSGGETQRPPVDNSYNA